MIVFSTNTNIRKSLGYKELAKYYLERYGNLCEDDFVVNMMCLLDDMEEAKSIKFERIMPSDWDFLLKAIRVLHVSVEANPN